MMIIIIIIIIIMIIILLIKGLHMQVIPSCDDTPEMYQILISLNDSKGIRTHKHLVCKLSS